MVSFFWSWLQSVSHLEFEALQGSGRAAVVVSSPSPCILLFSERGTSNLGAFYNRLRWTLDPKGIIILEHLRQGKSQFLVEFTSAGEGELISAQPHLCSQDRYTASLKLLPEGLLLSWQVQGPKKNEKMRYFYS